MLVGDWQNPLFNLDVTDDGGVGVQDVLDIVDDIHLHGIHPVTGPFDNNSPTATYLDVDGNGTISSGDVLPIVNYIYLHPLNQQLGTPKVNLSLQHDTGVSATDLLTNDPHLQGQATSSSGAISAAKVRINRGTVQTLALDAQGNFNLDPQTIQAIADGGVKVTVAVTSPGGVGLHQLKFNLKTTIPVLQTPHLNPADDTGISSSDNITKLKTPRLDIMADAGSQLQITVNGQPFDNVTVASTGSYEKSLGTLADGTYLVNATASDAAGNVTQLAAPVKVVIDTSIPAAPTLSLSLTSQTGSGPLTTGNARVTLVGKTKPNTFISLDANHSARSSGDGTFQIPNVTLTSGNNIFAASVVDVAGNTGANTQATIQHITQAGVTDPVLRWDAAALAAIQLDASAPPIASRDLAMMSLAMYDVVNNIQGTPTYAVSLAPPGVVSPEAAASSAAYEILTYAFPAQQAALQGVLTAALAEITNGQAKTDGVAYGKLIAQAYITMRSGDGWNKFVDYVPSSDVGKWQPTAPMYDTALLPQWGQLTPFAITSAAADLPPGPPALTSQAFTDAYNEVKSLGSATGSSRTADQTQVAKFWADGAGTFTPVGHWNLIASTVAQSAGNSWGDNARLFAELNATLGDAAIVSWDAKYTYEGWRPITAIQNAASTGNSSITADPNWKPLLVTPPFPEYVSGHSTFSAAAAGVLDDFFGSSVSFSVGSPAPALAGVQRSYTSFDQAAQEAGQSRIYGGIHFQFSNQDGLTTGHKIATEVLGKFSVKNDTLPPQVFFTSPAAGSASAVNPAVQGWVVDNLSGVASLQAAVDGGAYAAVTLDSVGKFTFTPSLLVDGTADGKHVIHFRAVDNAGNQGAVVDFQFMLDTKAPVIAITAPAASAAIAAGAVLTGSVDSAGLASGVASPLVSLSFQLDTGTVMPLSFNAATGAFNQPLDLSHAAAGAHVITVKAKDAAGNTSTQTVNVTLAAMIPFTIASETPSSGSSDVGSTFRPQVFFSRPVDPSTLNASDFYLHDSAGNKLPATIVPAADGTFAWLFPTNPMPGGSTITVHLDGSQIKTADGAKLDAAGTGTPGSSLDYQFTTVSLAPLANTSLSGIVADPGADLQPGTIDDVKAGPDGILHTADDIYLHPLANVKVYIIGMENHTVYTDAQGRFSFSGVPSGDVKLAIDGRTATNSPSGVYFPEMVMDLNLVVGQANTVMGTMGSQAEQVANQNIPVVYLPRVQTSILQTVSTTQDTMIQPDAMAAPNLTADQRAMLHLDVAPNTVVGMDGQPLAGAQVGISTVPPELVKDMLPPGLLQHTFDITIQAPGAAAFTQPLQMSFPNVFNAAPGTKLNFLSFDHTTGRLVIDGTATVSADGKSVVTDPGSGITKPGWHGVTPPGDQVTFGAVEYSGEQENAGDPSTWPAADPTDIKKSPKNGSYSTTNDGNYGARPSKAAANRQAIFNAVNASPNGIAVIGAAGPDASYAHATTVDGFLGESGFDHVAVAYKDSATGQIVLAEMVPNGQGITVGLGNTLGTKFGSPNSPGTVNNLSGEYNYLTAVPVELNQSQANELLTAIKIDLAAGKIYSFASNGNTCASSIAQAVRDSGVDLSFGLSQT